VDVPAIWWNRYRDVPAIHTVWLEPLQDVPAMNGRGWFPDPPMQEVPLDVMSSQEIAGITIVPNKLVAGIIPGRRAALHECQIGS
jgi:hypothetical protein